MKILFVAGSNHPSATSTNLSLYLERLARAQGFDTSFCNLHAEPLPFYSPQGIGAEEANVRAFKRQLQEADAIVLASPEYHGSISGVLKNALDFASQDDFRGKPVLSVSSAGGAVGVSSLQQLQAIVRNLHGINAPEWLSIGSAQRRPFEKASHGDYEVESSIEDRIHRVLGSFLTLARALGSHKTHA
nr:NADPH-dependent FMN reductase [Paenibacillus phyllosphaerae]